MKKGDGGEQGWNNKTAPYGRRSDPKVVDHLSEKLPILMTAADLSLRLQKHRHFCRHCKNFLKRKDNYKKCSGYIGIKALLDAQIERERWKPRQTPPPREGDALVTYMNPKCKHERTSYDLSSCPDCIEHTKLVKTGVKE